MTAPRAPDAHLESLASGSTCARRAQSRDWAGAGRPGRPASPQGAALGADNRHPWSMLVVVVGVLGVPMTLVNEVGVVAVLHVRVPTAGPVSMWVGPGIDVR